MTEPHFSVRPGRHGSTRTALAFTYPAKDVCIFDEIKQADAKAIAEAVVKQFPELAPIWGRYTAGAPIE